MLREYERGVIFRLGRLLRRPKGPGLILLIPIIDKMVRIDLRTVTLQVPPQEVITKDNVPVRVTAVAYFRVVDPARRSSQIENYLVATTQIAQTTLRSVLGQHSLDELLSERDKINEILQDIIDQHTSPWGIKISVVEVKDVELPTPCSAPWRARPRPSASGARRSSAPRASTRRPSSSARRPRSLVARARALQLRYLQTLLEIARRPTRPRRSCRSRSILSPVRRRRAAVRRRRQPAARRLGPTPLAPAPEPE